MVNLVLGRNVNLLLGAIFGVAVPLHDTVEAIQELVNVQSPPAHDGSHQGFGRRIAALRIRPHPEIVPQIADGREAVVQEPKGLALR